MQDENDDGREIHEGFELLLQVSARVAEDCGTFGAFADWARGAFPALWPPLDAGSEDDTSALAFWLARAIWNGMPLERNGYRPEPVPLPGRNEQCPCASGRKFKQCCRGIEFPPDLDEHELWPKLIDSYSDAHWLAEARRGVLPVIGVGALAHRMIDFRRTRALKELAETVLGDELKDPSMALLVDVVCDGYDELYKTDAAKKRLLERLAGHQCDTVRAAANQRLTSWLHDQGRHAEAWQAFERALQAAPNDPANAGLEISLLVSEKRYERARERAGFWQRRLARLRDVPDELRDFLDDVRADPRRALADIARGAAAPPIGGLLDWFEQQRGRPIPELRWTSVDTGPNAPTQLRDAHEPAPSEQEEALVSEWDARTSLTKPFSVQWLSGDELEAWGRWETWLPWLEAHPQAIDSLDILDDLIALLLEAEQMHSLIENPWLEQLLDRGVRILQAAWPPERQGKLPWLISENRPALRILARAIIAAGEEWDGRKWALLDTYLRLNPSDNHGFRGMVMNRLLVEGRDREALELAGRYSDDALVETTYGRVLALYRLAERGAAVGALTDAYRENPHVADYLLREKARSPRLEPGRVTLGGKDEAWHYRSDMREVWVSTPGLLAWLKPLVRKLKSAR